MTTNSKRPITEKQRQARRENGMKAHGATTAEGKDRSSRNATKHGFWARQLRPISAGPLREDPTEMEAFAQAYLVELNPGDSVILRQAAFDTVDKAWRLTRAQRWEAEGYSGAQDPSGQARQVQWLRALAARHRSEAETVRLFPDTSGSDDDNLGALCSLGFDVGLTEDDLEWIDNAEGPAIAQALATLIEDHFGDAESAASHLDERAAGYAVEADDLEDRSRPEVVRQEMDGSFARNAERLVSHASREFDRSLKRYSTLFDRYGNSGDDDEGRDSDFDYSHLGRAEENGDLDLDSEPDTAEEELGIFSRFTADEVSSAISILTGQTRVTGPDSKTRNEPTEANSTM